MILWLALPLLFLFLITHYLPAKYKKNRLAPEAGGGWPFIGHLHLLSRREEHPHLLLSTMADQYGPIFTIRLGAKRALVVSTCQFAKECLITNDLDFSNRPKTAAIQHMSYNFSMFGFREYGLYWRELRKICMLKLLSNHQVASLEDLFSAEIRALMASLYNSHQSPIDMNKTFEDFTFNLIVRIIAGDVVMNPEQCEREKWRGVIKEFFEKMLVLTIPDVLPYLKWFVRRNREFEKIGKKMDSILQAWLDEKKKHLSEAKYQGFMAEMIATAHKLAMQLPGNDADTINKATCQTLMLGATSALTITVTWALCLLLNNRHNLEKAQEELDIHVGSHRQVQASDMENLPYIRAIIKETLRLYPPTPLMPPRESMNNCSVAGYHIPAGTHLMINTWKLHRDPSVWADPTEFQPERFMTTHKEVDVRGLHYELLPFGAGRRVCPGISFALSVMELVLANLLHGFHIESTSKGPVDMTAITGSTTFEKASPLEVTLTPRLSPHLYA